MHKAAIVGCGWVGAAHAGGYQAIENCEIAGFQDSITTESRKLATKYGGESYETLEELLNESGADIVSVCTPPDMHHHVIQVAIESGINNIVCEKPLANKMGAARSISDLVSRNQSKFMLAFCHRFIEPVQKIKKLLDQGELGRPIMLRNEFSTYFEGVWNRWFSRKEVSGGGCMMDTSSHSIDLFRHLCGEVESVSARISTGLPELDVEDTSCLLLQSINGCIGILEASWNTKAGNAELEVIGTEGRAHYQYWGDLRVKTKGNHEWKKIPIERNINYRFEDELRHFIKVIDGQANEYPGVKDGLKSVEIINAAYQSVGEEIWRKL